MFLKAQAYWIVNGADSDAERMTVIVSEDFSKTKSFPSHSWLESFDGHSFMHIIIIFSRIEDKYMPLNKGQVKEIIVRALS